MAPSPQPTVMPIPRDWYEMVKRQSDVPVCVTTCMATSDIGNCTSVTDYTCLCNSNTYQQDVANCWASNCNATEIAYGEQYSAAGCAAFGVTVTSIFSGSVTGTPTPAATASSTGASSVAGTTAAAPLDTTTPPNVYTRTGTNISAIMSSICGALLLLAIVLGVHSVRARIKKQEAMSQNRSWTGAGSSMPTDKDSKNSKFAFSKNTHSSFTNSRGQTSTFASDNYGMTSSNFGGNSTLGTGTGTGVGVGVGAGRFSTTGGAGFSNRMAPVGDEEWEMGSKDDGKLESPTTPTTKIGMSESEIDLSSTTQLNRLDKGDGGLAL